MSLRVRFVDLAAQQAALAHELRQAIEKTATRADWILGDEVALFEAEFADYCETAHAVGTDSGLSALELALLALDIGPGHEVITAANTFVATAFAISHVGAMPVFVDIDPSFYTLDPLAVENAITPRTKAVVPVHLYGHPANMETLAGIADRHGLALVEDACQAHGARYKGRRVGSFGDAAAFSFYPSKNLGAHGDAGIVVTNDPELHERLRTLRNYGQRRKNEHVAVGYNHRLDTLQAAILRVKLPYLDAWNALRRAIAATYARLLDGSGVVTPLSLDDVEAVWHLYVVRVEARDALRASLAQQGIETGIHYPVPPHLQRAYADLGYGRGSFPVTERCAEQVLSLPMYPELSRDAVERVATGVREFASTGLPADASREHGALTVESTN